jgi:DNA-binding transcriptional MerR regulator
VALEVALRVQQELQTRVDEADSLRHKQVERARYEAELAQRRYMQVDPDNRLVADTLEADWNEKLRVLTDAQEQYEKQRAADATLLGDEQRARVLALATDFPRLWRDPRTPQRERKRMVRLLLEDVTLVKAKEITVHVRFRGGASRSLALPLPKCSWELRQTAPEVIREIDALLERHTDQEIADILNQRGRRSGDGLAFRRRIVFNLRRDHGLTSRLGRLRDSGMLSVGEMARKLGVSTSTVKAWANAGLLRAERYNDKGQRLYAQVDGATLRKQRGSKLSRRLPRS